MLSPFLRAFRALGAELALTYLNDKAKPHVEPLAAGLGEAFTAETREAWAALYSHVAETMLRGAMHAGAMAEA